MQMHPRGDWASMGACFIAVPLLHTAGSRTYVCMAKDVCVCKPHQPVRHCWDITALPRGETYHRPHTAPPRLALLHIARLAPPPVQTPLQRTDATQASIRTVFRAECHVCRLGQDIYARRQGVFPVGPSGTCAIMRRPSNLDAPFSPRGIGDTPTALTC